MLETSQLLYFDCLLGKQKFIIIDKSIQIFINHCEAMVDEYSDCQIYKRKQYVIDQIKNIIRSLNKIYLFFRLA